MFLRHGRVLLLLTAILFSNVLPAQIVWYPGYSSDLLKSTAEDIAVNFRKAIPGSNISIQEYNVLPITGIILKYDSTMLDNGACKISSDGSSYLKFEAAQDNGLMIGVYQYLQTLGFRFYLPGNIWEKIPVLASPYLQVDKFAKVGYKYNTWFISGGYSSWAMDKSHAYDWDIYSGTNGHAWSKYQRRNLMTGAYRFNGHRGDIYTPDYIAKLNANKCFISSNNGQRVANFQSTPDINNLPAKDLWANEIANKYSGYKNTIFHNQQVYSNLYHNFDFHNAMIGLEVGDGAKWGNSSDNFCNPGNWNGAPYPSESDQQFLLVNHSAAKISTTLFNKNFQAYAYDGHANVPTFPVTDKVDIQVVSTAFQLESSSKALLNRWYNKHSNISEYHYFNIPQWGGETPVSSVNDLQQTINRIRSKNAQGLVIETSPAKFANLPFLLAANRSLQAKVDMDSSITEFTNAMFPQGTAKEIKKLLGLWGNEQVFTIGDYFRDNKYKLSLFLQILKKAELTALSENAGPLVMQRLQEFKAYTRYLKLYYELVADNRPFESKISKVEFLCKYLAEISSLQIVNSYFLIQDLLYKFPETHNIWGKYNLQNGSAYMNGQLSAVTALEIDQNFNTDILQYAEIERFDIKALQEIVGKFLNSNLSPLEQIDVKIMFTNGKDYSNRTEFYIYADKPGSFTIKSTPEYQMAGKGFLNFAVESIEDPLLILKDVTVSPEVLNAELRIDIPSKGFYKLSILSKFKTVNQVSIKTNGLVFFRNGPFYGNMVEIYRNDLTKLPRFFHVPKTLSKLYFSINNGCSGNTYITAADVQSAFSVRDPNGDRPTIKASGSDSSLFYMNIPASGDEFWQVNTMREYNLCFANIANVEFYAEQKKCDNANFTISIIKKGDECITRMIASANSNENLKWEIYDAGRWSFFQGIKSVDLPLLSPKAIITLKNNSGCFQTQKTGSANYLQQLEACATASALPELKINVFPNPSSDKFNFTIGGLQADFDVISIYDIHGKLISNFTHVSSISLKLSAGGIYIYKARKGDKSFQGKLGKL